MVKLIAPGTVLTTAVILGLLNAALLLWLALSQPWLGVSLHGDPDTGRAVALSVDPAGPSRALPAGAEILQIAPQRGAPVALRAADLIEEPDMLGSGGAMSGFFARQSALHSALSGGEVEITYATGTGSDPMNLVVTPVPVRPLSDLPIAFWTQLLVALAGLWFGAWVLALRLHDPAAWMLSLAGLGLALAAQAAALYSSRELALSLPVFGTASRINGIGTMTFGIGMVTLFLIYPRRLVRGALTALPALMISAAIIWMEFIQWPRFVPMLQGLVALAMLVLLAALAVQVWVNRRDPRARAMLGWFGLSIALGAGGFVLTVIVPVLIGQPPILAQSTAFLLFLVIYAGLGLGVMRYRLFDLTDWSFRLLFYGLGMGMMLGQDAVLVMVLSLDHAAALAASLALVAIVYLPVRRRMSGWLRRENPPSAEAMFTEITEIAQAEDRDTRIARLCTLLRRRFDPLSVAVLQEARPAAVLEREGEGMVFPAVDDLPAIRLQWAMQGRRLFSSRDLNASRRLAGVIGGAIDQHRTYRDAVNAERGRINRDMHDNIGVLLLSALHSSGVERKNLLIRQTLSDLREIISNPAHESWDLARLLADLRAEIADHLDAAGLALDWQAEAPPGVSLSPRRAHTLRAFLREGVSNLLRHAGAGTAMIRITASGTGAEAALSLLLADDGSGFDPDHIRPGNGFVNLRERVAQCQGSFSVQTDAQGTRLSATLPLSAADRKAQP
ncbi:hypothetical protein SAMN05421538_102288 [Paracoccus isoporae]|uniref:Histidine kinase domain-containing protein n=1 Tax=Paracoccus isoporae TaxID=591205 RepID=A0A1G6X551_9RHOB|nr:hypothetical protein SAMN05421538_102288 [Paracoccus isoporae]